MTKSFYALIIPMRTTYTTHSVDTRCDVSDRATSYCRLGHTVLPWHRTKSKYLPFMKIKRLTRADGTQRFTLDGFWIIRNHFFCRGTLRYLFVINAAARRENDRKWFHATWLFSTVFSLLLSLCYINGATVGGTQIIYHCVNGKCIYMFVALFNCHLWT